MNRILIIEDDPEIVDDLAYHFQREGFVVFTAESAEKGLRFALNERHQPDLILLDMTLPGMRGLDLCRRLRRESATSQTPIIVLTAKTTESDLLEALELGADDYLTKPFSVKEAGARARAILRRATERSFEVYEDDRIKVDVGGIRVECRGADVKLTKKEFALLVFLIRNAGRVPTREQLLDHVWGYDYYGDTRTLDVHIRRLRQKLGDCGESIETVVGVGYRFIPQ